MTGFISPRNSPVKVPTVPILRHFCLWGGMVGQYLDGGFKYVLFFIPKIGKTVRFDLTNIFPKGLVQPPTRKIANPPYFTGLWKTVGFPLNNAGYSKTLDTTCMIWDGIPGPCSWHPTDYTTTALGPVLSVSNAWKWEKGWPCRYKMKRKADAILHKQRMKKHHDVAIWNILNF